MKISSIPSFRANFNDCERYLCDAEKQAYQTGRLKEFRKATWNLDRCFPNGEIEKYSSLEKDVFCFSPNTSITISIPNTKNKTRELDSLIKLANIIEKMDK